jgi:hypothetical protein
MGDLVTTQNTDLLEQVVVGGDLARLSASQRLEYYSRVCESMGLNPLTQPFQYIRLNGKLTLYATRAAADQLRKLNGVSITNLDVDLTGDMAVVTCSGRDNGGRADTDVGVVPLKGLGGDARANAVLKAVTKAKRRMTLSLCGLGWLDETEIETIPDAQPVTVTNAGEIAEPNDGDQHEQDKQGQPPSENKSTTNGDGNKPPVEKHWIEKHTESGTPVRNIFWQRMSDLGLSNDQVHKALGVESVKDYAGSMADARKAIDDWINAQVEQGEMTEAEAVGL